MAEGPFTPRSYEREIAQAASVENTLVVLPTGLGKTEVALLVAKARLERFPRGKIVVLAPTKPLALQHETTFRDLGAAKKGETYVMTGESDPNRRGRMWRRASFVFATPQALMNDAKTGRVDLYDVVLMVFDEAHRSVRDYDYTKLARAYMGHAAKPLIIGLTASPGGTRKRIEEIARRLFAERIEARDEDDADVKPYVQRTAIEGIRVPVPAEYLSARSSLASILDEKVASLTRGGCLRRGVPLSKTMLLRARGALASRLKRAEGAERQSVERLLDDQAQAVLVSHAVELLETQGGQILQRFLEGLRARKGPASVGLAGDPRWLSVEGQAELLARARNPKLDKLVEVVASQVKSEPESKVMVFCQYRDTVNMVVERLKAAKVMTARFVGQARRSGDEGMDQARQTETLKRFQKGRFDVLVSSSIGEEGLHVPAVDLVVFYEAVPSEIRYIQRKGRTGRNGPGKVVILLGEGTVDEAYYRTSLYRERSMRALLSGRAAGRSAEPG